MPLEPGSDHAAGANLFDDVLKVAELFVDVVGRAQFPEIFELLVQLADPLAKLLEFLIQFLAGIF